MHASRNRVRYVGREFRRQRFPDDPAIAAADDGSTRLTGRDRRHFAVRGLHTGTQLPNDHADSPAYADPAADAAGDSVAAADPHASADPVAADYPVAAGYPDAAVYADAAADAHSAADR
jgi:hypothetical protein